MRSVISYVCDTADGSLVRKASGIELFSRFDSSTKACAGPRLRSRSAAMVCTSIVRPLVLCSMLVVHVLDDRMRIPPLKKKTMNRACPA